MAQAAVRAGARPPVDGENPYWLGPFQNYKTFCPYLVGSYDGVAARSRATSALGFKTFILDIPPSDEELQHTAVVFERGKERRVAVTLLQDYVTRQAERGPTRRVVMGDERLTYGELEERRQPARAAAREGGLRARRPRLPVRAEDARRRSSPMLGVLKADCAYVPIDIASPAPRVEMIVESSEPP